MRVGLSDPTPLVKSPAEFLPKIVHNPPDLGIGLAGFIDLAYGMDTHRAVAPKIPRDHDC